MRFLMLALVATTLVQAQDLKEEMTVTYREMRIHVLDENNQPVRGLTHEDLNVWFDQQQLDIGFFEEIDFAPADKFAPGASAEEGERVEQGAGNPVDDRFRFITLLIDSGQMRKRHFKTAIFSMKDFILRRAGGKTYLRLVQLDGGEASKTDFSNQPSYLIDALDRIEYSGNTIRQMMVAQLEINRNQQFVSFAQSVGSEFAESFSIGLGESVLTSLLIKENVRLSFYAKYAFVLNHLANDLASTNGERSLFMFTGGQYQPPWMTARLGQELSAKGMTLYTLLYDSARPVPFAGESNYEHYTITHTTRKVTEQSGGIFAKSSSKRGQTERFSQLEQAADHYYRIAFMMPAGEGELRVMPTRTGSGWTIQHGSAARLNNVDIQKQVEEAMENLNDRVRFLRQQLDI